MGAPGADITPALMIALPELLAEEGPTYQGAALLLTPAPPGRDQHLVCGPHCQCSFLSPEEESRNPQCATMVMERAAPPCRASRARSESDFFAART